MISPPPILLVEDNPKDEALTIMAFEENHIKNKIVVAHDGEEALDYLFGTGTYKDKETEYPQLVLLDLKLPKMSGLEVLERIRANQQTELLPIIILTSSKEDSDLLKSYRLRANAYVRKPVDFVEFTQAVKELSVFWLLINANPPAVLKR